MALTKTELVELIAEKNNLKAREVLEEFLGIMKSTFSSGEELMISRFDKFPVNDKAPTKGRIQPLVIQ